MSSKIKTLFIFLISSRLKRFLIVGCSCPVLSSTISYDEFDTILKRESSNELDNLPSKTDKEIYWDEVTNNEWNINYNTKDKQPNLFIIRDDTINMSSYKRKLNIEKRILELAKQNDGEKQQVAIAEYPISSTDEATYFIASLPLALSKRLATLDCCTCLVNSTCIVQPFLPIMKLGIDVVTKAIEIPKITDHVQEVTVTATLAPFAFQNHTDMASVIASVMKRTNETRCLELRNSLPFTSSLLKGMCEEENCEEYLTVKVKTQQFDDFVIYSIETGGKDIDSIITTEQLLILLTGLASRAEISYVELSDDRIINFTR